MSNASRFLVIFNIILVVPVLITSASANHSSIIQGRIAGGQNAVFRRIPWQLSIRIRDQHKCSGALIKGINGAHFALTLATCLSLPKPNKSPYPKEVMTVVAGRININSPSEYEQERKVRYMWGNWGRFDWDNHKWDIALIVLDSNFNENEVIAPINLPAPTQPYYTNDGFVTVSGWGYTKQNENSEEIKDLLQVARIPIVDWTRCQNKYYGRYGYDGVRDDSACAGSSTEGACKLDEGSPAVGISQEGELYLWGIFQWTQGNCPDDYFPGIYANVAKYMTWIDEKSQVEKIPFE